MPIDISAVAEYTDAEILKMARKAMIDLTIAEETQWFNGQRVRKADLDDIMKLAEYAEKRVNAATSGNGVVLGVFGDPA